MYSLIKKLKKGMQTKFYNDNEDTKDFNTFYMAISESQRIRSEVESVFKDKPEVEYNLTLLVDDGKVKEEIPLVPMDEELHKASEDCEGLEKLQDIESNDFFKSFTDGINHIMESDGDWYYCVQTENDGEICFDSEFVLEMLEKYLEHDDVRDIDPPDSDNFMSNVMPGCAVQEQEWDMFA